MNARTRTTRTGRATAPFRAEAAAARDNPVASAIGLRPLAERFPARSGGESLTAVRDLDIKVERGERMLQNPGAGVYP